MLYANEIKRKIPRNIFRYLLRTWHFSENEAHGLENDRLQKLTHLANNLNLNNLNMFWFPIPTFA